MENVLVFLLSNLDRCFLTELNVADVEYFWISLFIKIFKDFTNNIQDNIQQYDLHEGRRLYLLMHLNIFLYFYLCRIALNVFDTLCNIFFEIILMDLSIWTILFLTKISLKGWDT